MKRPVFDQKRGRSAMRLWTALVIALSVLTVPALAAPSGSGATSDLYIALITDVGNIDDKSFNEGSYNGVIAYAEETGAKYDYFRPSEDTTTARVETMESAISRGANVLVCPGSSRQRISFARTRS